MELLSLTAPVFTGAKGTHRYPESSFICVLSCGGQNLMEIQVFLQKISTCVLFRECVFSFCFRADKLEIPEKKIVFGRKPIGFV